MTDNAAGTATNAVPAERAALSQGEFMAIRDAMALFLRALLGNPMLTDDYLELFVRECESSSAIGPFVDPTLFMGDGFAKLRTMTNDARDLTTLTRSVRERHPELT